MFSTGAMGRISITLTNSKQKSQKVKIIFALSLHFNGLITSKISHSRGKYGLENMLDKTDLSLHATIFVTEVTFALKQMKNEKATGLDQLSNEMLKSFGHLYPEYLSSFFTKVLFKKFPELWTTGLITPIYNEVQSLSQKNYVVILSRETFHLNERLFKYSIQKNIIANKQIGFLRGNRTSDNRNLHSLVQEKLKSSKSCFHVLLILKKLLIT